MGKKRIWIVTELFHPEETAVAFIFTRIANFLSEKYEICVICGPEFYDSNKKDYRDLCQISDKIKIFRVDSLKLDKNSLIQRSLKLFMISVRMMFLMLKEIKRGEVVLLGTNPAPLLPLVCLFKKYKNIQLHILVHDIFPENTIPAKVFESNNSLIFKFLKCVYDRSYAYSDHLIAIGRDMREILIEKTIKFNQDLPISVVPNWSDPSKIIPEFQKFSFTPEVNTNKKIIFQYAGNIGRVQGLDVLIDSFILANNPDIHLILRGTGAMYGEIKDIIYERKLENISLLGGYSRNEENKMLSDCHVSIVSLSKGMLGLGVPSKSYHILSAGNPILFIGESKSEISLMVKENNIGWSISNSKLLTNFFKEVKWKDLNELHEKGLRSRQLAENKYSEECVLEMLQSCMERLFVD